MNEPTELTFEAWLLPRFSSRIEELAKIAAKLSCEPMTFEVVERFEREEIDEWTLVKHTVKFVRVALSGETPRLPGGWEFIGSIEHADAGNLVHGDDPDVEGFRSAGPNCEHCETKRGRRKTVLLRDADGIVVQVGSSCMKDFLGYHGNPERVLRLMLDFGSLEDDLDEYRHSARVWGAPVRLLLAATIGSNAVFGWRPKSLESAVPTVSIVKHVLGTSELEPMDKIRLQKDISGLLEDAMGEVFERYRAEPAKVDEVLAWASEIPDTADTYLLNLRTLLGAEYAEQRHFGMICSAVSAYDKATAKKIDKAAEELEEKAPTPVGRVVLEGTVLTTRWQDNDFGGSLKMLLKCEGFKVWGTVPSKISVEQGDRVRLTGTVERSNDDESFGFYSRPSKAEVLIPANADS